MAMLVTLYIVVTLAYHWVLPFADVVAASKGEGATRAIAASYCQRLLGPTGVQWRSRCS